MRILLISSNSSRAGGGEQYFVYLAKGLKEIGEDPIALLSDKKYMDAWEKRFKEIGVQVKRADLTGLRDRPLRFFQSINDKKQIKLIASICSELSPDVIHVNQQYDADGLDYLMGAMRYQKALVISTLHMPMSLTKHARPGKSARTWLINALALDKAKRAILRGWYKRYNYTKIFPAEAMKNEFAAVYGEDNNLHVVTHGIDISSKPYSINQSKTPTIGFCGRFDPQKDLLLLIRTWLNMWEKGIESNLLLIGDGILRKKIEKKLRKEAPANTWNITGWVNNPQDYINKIDLLLLTSKFEGFPIAAIEASSAGKRCICTNFPGSSEIAEKIPYLKVVNSRSPGVLSQAIAESFTESDPQRVDVEKVRTFFSCARMAKDTLVLYKKRLEKEKSKITLIWPDFSFYHVTRFKALHARVGDRVLGIEFIGGAGDHETAQWRYTKRKNLPIVTLFPDKDIKELSRRALGHAVVNKLKQWNADAIFVNGYSTPELRIVIDWAYRNNKKCFTFFESKKDDFKRFFISEYFKKRIIKKLNGAICGGKLHRDYLIELGMPEENIYFGYDVVNNDFFKEKSLVAAKNDEFNRRQHDLPRNYFVTSSRFVRKKNLIRLLDAYKIYRNMFESEQNKSLHKTKMETPWGLVLCGDGSQKRKLVKKVERENIIGVKFAGSKEPEELALYYGLASAFILASTQEQWGLAINEAMASGLPILTTSVAGAGQELVEDGVNGYKFDPLDVGRLARLMLAMTNLGQKKLAEMGKKSREKITAYSPEYFAENIIKAI